MISGGRRDILGVGIDVVDYESAVDRIVRAGKDSRPFAATALAVHGVMTGALDAVQRFRLNRLDLVVPDGQPVRWALNLLYGTQLADRVYGPALMLAVCERCAKESLPIFLFGSSRVVLEQLRERLQHRFPSLTIAGVEPSKFRRITSDEKRSVVDRIKSSGARVVFVGLGCPRQEVWAFEYRDDLAIPVVAVGAAFDFHSGTLPQAPSRLQRLGLEWLYRLSHEPRRLWRRYALLNPLYVGMILAQATRLMRFDTRPEAPPQGEMNYG